jgi:phosphoribosylglycinamide formyltransferase-1
MNTEHTFSVVVLISGNGSNLQSIIDDPEHGINYTVKAVISNNHDAYGLVRAQNRDIETVVVDHKLYQDRSTYDQALQSAIDQFKPDLVVLAGFMRILTTPFVEHFLGRMINIHPSLLPKYRGLNTHQKAIDAGDVTAGCTVHYVTPELDAGPIITQVAVKINTADTAESLAARVLTEEHKIYPKVIHWIVSNLVRLDDSGVVRFNHQTAI